MVNVIAYVVMLIFIHNANGAGNDTALTIENTFT